MTDSISAETFYQVLARKYRPRNFDDLKGHPILVKTLRNAILSNRLPHAILLIGHRGIGKTTTARIIAQTLNCQNIDLSSIEKINPCGVCEACRSIQSGQQLDVIEMDAASNSSIENIRPIVESGSYKPVDLKYKIFIIDEVHMLSKYAFNALLKTLEEPPPHLKFIFATTELSRIPDTIISRCIRFDLHPFSINDLKDLIKNICEQENVTIDERACALLAYAAYGSARDALSLLDQAINSLGTKIEFLELRDMLGYAQQNIVFELIVALSGHQVLDVIKLYNSMVEKGASSVIILKEVSHIIYQLILLKNGYHKVDNGLIDHDDLKQLGQISLNISYPTLMRLWQSLHKGIEDIKYSHSISEAGLMILIRLCYLSELPDTAQLISYIIQDEKPSTHIFPMIEPLVPASNFTLAEIDTPLPELDEVFSQKDEPVAVTPVKTQSKSSVITTITDLINLCTDHKEPLLRCKIEKDIVIRHIDSQNFTIYLSLLDMAPKKLPQEIKIFLREVTGHKWNLVIESNNDNIVTHDVRKKLDTQQLYDQVTAHPDVQQILDKFPGAKVTHVNKVKKAEQ